MRYQSHLDKSAPVAARPAEAEWTREMDWAIGEAVGEIRPEITVVNGVALQIMAPLRYSTDLEDVVRAAEKWQAMHGYGMWLRQCGRVEWDCRFEGGDIFIAPTPALALAKALYAAIRAEGEKMAQSVFPTGIKADPAFRGLIEYYQEERRTDKAAANEAMGLRRRG